MAVFFLLFPYYDLKYNRSQRIVQNGIEYLSTQSFSLF